MALLSEQLKEGTLADAGIAGSMEILNIADLHVDRAYQRDLSIELVQKIAAKWDVKACGPILVSRRPNGDCYIVNGQHRAAAAKMAGESEILAHVVDGMGEKEEAELRLRGNTRLSDRSLERFRAQVAAGHHESLDIVAILGRFGTQINPQVVTEQGINAVSAVERIYRVDKGLLLVKTLEVIKEAFGTPGGKNATAGNMAAIAWFLRNHPAEEYDRNRLIDRLRTVGLAALDRMARNMRAAMGGAMWVNIYRAMIEVYNEGLSEAKRLEWRTRGTSSAYAIKGEYDTPSSEGIGSGQSEKIATERPGHHRAIG